MKIFDPSSPSLENSRWSYNSKTGMKLKNPTFSDSAFYFCIGSMNTVNNTVNGRRINISHDIEDNQNFLSMYVPSLGVNTTDVVYFSLIAKGIAQIVSSQLDY